MAVFEARKGEGCPAESPWAVLSDEQAEPLSCHFDQGGAFAQIDFLLAEQSAAEGVNYPTASAQEEEWEELEDELWLLELLSGWPRRVG